MEIGYSKDNNLSESLSDDRIWSNLAGEDIVPSIRLFSNNTKAFSALNSNDYEIIENNIINVTNGFKVAYSNRTKVTVNNKEYQVESSDGQTQFQLIDIVDGTLFVPNSETDSIIRSDVVTFENLQNLNVERFETNIIDSESDEQTSLFNRNNIAENLSTINSTLSSFYLIQNRVPFTINENRFKDQIVFEGTLRVPPQSNFDISSPDSPGIFILSPDGESNRAFSDTSNPWSENESTNTLETQAQNVTVNDVRFSKGNDVEIKGISVTTNADQPVLSEFTHKLRVKINGEDYSLLVRKSS